MWYVSGCGMLIAQGVQQWKRDTFTKVHGKRSKLRESKRCSFAMLGVPAGPSGESHKFVPGSMSYDTCVF